MPGQVRTPYCIAGHSINQPKPSDEDYTLHCHSFYEIYYFIRGDVEYRIEGVPYHPEADSMLLIESNVFHGFLNRGTQVYDRYTIHFQPDFMPDKEKQIILSPFHNKAVYYTHVSRKGLHPLVEALIDASSMPDAIADAVIQARLLSLLAQIYQLRAKPLFAETAAPEGRFVPEEILTFINLNLTTDMTLDKICRRFYISKNHLNRIFRASTGTTVATYINLKRITMARQFMLAGQSAGEAAINAGFRDYTTFYRAYKKQFGHSPRADMGESQSE
ncbi:AraC family transcriptional regulator [Ruminococcaceae bacterium OttesenSCG-928-L11]|nr:AraC family transcriptional regulator [Ruminococcaceae bacterium OttesenSCG-928-L11]